MNVTLTGKIRNYTGDQNEVLIRFNRPLTDDEIQRLAISFPTTIESEQIKTDPYDHPYDMSTNPVPADANIEIK